MRSFRHHARSALVLLTVFTCGCGGRAENTALNVYAASSLTDAMEVLADTFEARSGRSVVLNVAGSSLLARQIERGARADLFVSAHPSWTDYLRRASLIGQPMRLPLTNRLVEARRTSRGGDDPRIALADPAHVPAGVYAREALECAGRWTTIEAHVVPTLDVRAALAAVETGAVPAAIVYASDALLAPTLAIRDAVTDSCQPEISYTAAILQDARQPEVAAQFLALLRDPDMEPVWRQFGFMHDSDRD